MREDAPEQDRLQHAMLRQWLRWGQAESTLAVDLHPRELRQEPDAQPQSDNFLSPDRPGVALIRSSLSDDAPLPQGASPLVYTGQAAPLFVRAPARTTAIA